jgi:hypothetical protein
VMVSRRPSSVSRNPVGHGSAALAAMGSTMRVP